MAQAIFILFITSFIVSCGYLLKAHYQAIALLQSLETLVIAAEEGVSNSGVTVEDLTVTLQLQNSLGESTLLQQKAFYYSSKQPLSMGIIRVAGLA